MSHKKFHRESTRSGFTLVELLTVIAVIAVLACILIPVVQGALASSRLTSCTANFRQIGQAMTLYVAENKGQLPGPLYSSQGPAYSPAVRDSSTRYGRLTGFLVPYMDGTDIVDEGTSSSVITNFVCPAWEAEKGTNRGIMYDMHGNVSTAGGGHAHPFGQFYRSQPDRNSAPIRYSQLADPAKEWAMREVDGENASHNNMVEHPVHGTVRNYLYFDGHVRAVGLDETP